MRVVFLLFCLLGLGAVAWTLVYAARRRRIPIGRSFTGTIFAERRTQPRLYWLALGLHVMIGLVLIDWLATGPQ